MGALLFSDFRQIVRICTTCKRSARFVTFALGERLFSLFSKLHHFVQNIELSPKSPRFVISALGEPLF